MTRTRDVAARLLCALGVPRYARWKHSRQLAILMFHGVQDEPLGPPCDWGIDTAALRRCRVHQKFVGDFGRRHANMLVGSERPINRRPPDSTRSPCPMS